MVAVRLWGLPRGSGPQARGRGVLQRQAPRGQSEPQGARRRAACGLGPAVAQRGSQTPVCAPRDAQTAAQRRVRSRAVVPHPLHAAWQQQQHHASRRAAAPTPCRVEYTEEDPKPQLEEACKVECLKEWHNYKVGCRPRAHAADAHSERSRMQRHVLRPSAGATAAQGALARESF